MLAVEEARGAAAPMSQLRSVAKTEAFNFFIAAPNQTAIGCQRTALPRCWGRMKESFHGYFVLSDDEFAGLWQSSLISFDASTLLNLYRYSPASSTSLIELLEIYTDRIRLPHQFSLEYARNRPKVIVEQANKYVAALAAFESFENDWIVSNRQHPYLSEAAQLGLKEIKSALSEAGKEMERLISDDRYARFLLSACAGKVGKAPSEEALNDMHQRAKERYDKKIPPGYLDLKDKEIPRAYGDFIAWEQLIEVSKAEARDLILIIDDLKEDWWWKESGKTIGPRSELLEEFRQRAGQKIWIYTSLGFLHAAKNYANAPVSDELLREAAEQQEGVERQLEARSDKSSPLSGQGAEDKSLRLPWDDKIKSGSATTKSEAQMSSVKPVPDQFRADKAG